MARNDPFDGFAPGGERPYPGAERPYPGDEEELQGHNRQTGKGMPEKYEQLLAFSPTPGVPVTTADATVSNDGRPQRRFWPERVILDDAADNLGNWTLSSVQIGSIPQFISNSGVTPSSIFGPTAVGVRMKMNACGPGYDVEVTAETVIPPSGSGDLIFAAMIGPAAMPRM